MSKNQTVSVLATPVRHCNRECSSAGWTAIVLGLVALGSLPACSTVNVDIRPDRVTQDGLETTRALKSIAKAPFTALGNFAQSAEELLRGDDSNGAGSYLKAAIDSRELLLNKKEVDSPEAQKALVDLHNQTLSQFAEEWFNNVDRGHTKRTGNLSFDGNTFEIREASDSDYPLSYFDRVVATISIREKGLVVKKRDGYGATLVGIRDYRQERAEEMQFYPKRGLHVAVTMTVNHSSANGTNIVSISLKNPSLHQTAKVGNSRLPLSADFSAPIAMLLAGQNELLAGLEGFFKAEKRLKASGLFLLEPYDPNRIPVILTHGLVSVPNIWRDIIPEMMSEPDIARRYQFMAFRYPSSYVIPESALLFRQELAALRAKYDPESDDPLSNDVLAVGHSMGGVLTHLLVADIGTRFWDQISDKPVEALGLDPETEARVRELAFFEPDPGVTRAIFISAPHRGAKKAGTNLANIVSTLVRLPTDIVTSTVTIALSPILESDDLKIKYGKKMTSVQSLQPDSAIVKALDNSPYKKGVVYHSIIGDRGKGDTPNSSDGMVDYWSSHQENAASELIVPTGHSSYKDPHAIAEIKRIARLHAN